MKQAFFAIQIALFFSMQMLPSEAVEASCGPELTQQATPRWTSLVLHTQGDAPGRTYAQATVVYRGQLEISGIHLEGSTSGIRIPGNPYKLQLHFPDRLSLAEGRDFDELRNLIVNCYRSAKSASPYLKTSTTCFSTEVSQSNPIEVTAAMSYSAREGQRRHLPPNVMLSDVLLDGFLRIQAIQAARDLRVLNWFSQKIDRDGVINVFSKFLRNFLKS
jgi:hypothetical protein